MSGYFSNLLLAAAQSGDVRYIGKLIEHGAMINGRSRGITPLMAAAMAGKIDAVEFLLANGADAWARDQDSRTLIKMTLDNGHIPLAQLLVDRCPNLLVTDPRLPQGEDWLRGQFDLIMDNVKDPASKPRRELLDRLIAGNLGPTEDRDASDVYWEHIFLRYIGDVPLDIERNYSEDLVLSLVGTFDRILYGHEGNSPLHPFYITNSALKGIGVRESARLLNSKLPTTQYRIIGTVVDVAGGWVTERWTYDDAMSNLRVANGIDTFLIEEGKIKVMMINYIVHLTDPITSPGSKSAYSRTFAV